ncbi:hypothetical protein D3C76_1543250 [compost metagenome]
MGASTVPISCCTTPWTTAIYLRVTVWSFSCWARDWWAWSFLAAIISPDVSLSMRWTTPGRNFPLMPDRSLQ